MVTTELTRTLDTTPEALWECVRAFGEVPWMKRGRPEVRGEGVGQLRIFQRPYGEVQERLSALDDDARSLSYTIPAGNPFPVHDYEATMRVGGETGRATLCWSCRYQPDAGEDPDAIAHGLLERFGAVIDLMERYLTRNA